MMLPKRRLVIFLVCAAGAVVLTWSPLRNLVQNGRPADYYKHIPLIPIISAYILFRRKDRLFRGEPGSPILGTIAIVLSLCLFAIDVVRQPSLIGHVELAVTGAVLLLVGSFLMLFGRNAFGRALFPFFFLVFMVPLPIAWMEHIVSALVAGSMGVTHLLFTAFGVPLIREGAIFRLPGVDLEVAQQCSGIRSSLALLITSVLAGQVFLTGRWRKIALALAVFPVTIFKNGVRIATLYLLSYFVDMRIIQGGFLHKSGGFVFFGLGLVALAYVLWLLRKPIDSRTR